MFVEITKEELELFNRNQRIINSCVNFLQLENCLKIISLVNRTHPRVSEALRFIYNQKLTNLNETYEKS